MRRLLALSVFLSFLFLPTEAHLSQVHYTDVSLEQLVARSELVLVVKTAQPPQRQISMPVGKGKDGKEAPPFLRVQTRCEVLAALTKGAQPLVGKTLEIDGANWQETRAMHEQYYLEGLGVSPIFERYQPAEKAAREKKPEEKKDAPYIVFLRRTGANEYAFEVEGASDRIANRGAIEALIRSRKK